jgi:hypothetical protein
MTGPKSTPKQAEPRIALTVNDHNAQQAFQLYVAGVAQAFREKQHAQQANRVVNPVPAVKVSTG